MRSLGQVALALLCLTSGAVATGEQLHRAGCTEADAQRADGKLGRFSATLDRNPVAGQWRRFYALYVQYGHCDDGAIAEDFSDIAARLLARHWDHVSELFDLANEDEAFFRFVLRHLDATDDDGDLLWTRKNARKSCPAGNNDLCERIAQASMRALEAIKHIGR